MLLLGGCRLVDPTAPSLNLKATPKTQGTPGLDGGVSLTCLLTPRAAQHPQHMAGGFLERPGAGVASGSFSESDDISSGQNGIDCQFSLQNDRLLSSRGSRVPSSRALINV